MKRFRFTLESVLKVRRAREETIQREFSVFLEKRAVALAGLAQLELELEGIVDRQGRELRQGGSLDRFQVSQFELSRGACIENIKWQSAQVREIEAGLEKKRVELVEASRQRKVLEKLEEGQFQAYLAKGNREEQIFLDELAQFNAARPENSSHP